MSEKLGKLEISNHNDRFCLAIPPEGSRYVHEHMEDDGFIRDFTYHRFTVEDYEDIYLQG